MKKGSVMTRRHHASFFHAFPLCVFLKVYFLVFGRLRRFTVGYYRTLVAFQVVDLDIAA